MIATPRNNQNRAVEATEGHTGTLLPTPLQKDSRRYVLGSCGGRNEAEMKRIKGSQLLRRKVFPEKKG